MVFDEIVSILSSQYGFDKSEITMDTNILDDLHIDSIDMVDLIMTIEDEYGIAVEDEDMENIATIRDIVSYIENAVG